MRRTRFSEFALTYSRLRITTRRPWPSIECLLPPVNYPTSTTHSVYYLSSAPACRRVSSIYENPQAVHRLLHYSLMFCVGNGYWTWFEAVLSPVNYPTSTTHSDVLSSTIVSPYAPGQNSARLLGSTTMNYVGNGFWTPFEVYFLFRSLSDINNSLRRLIFLTVSLCAPAQKLRAGKSSVHRLFQPVSMNCVGNSSSTSFKHVFVFLSLSDITGSLCDSPRTLTLPFIPRQSVAQQS